MNKSPLRYPGGKTRACKKLDEIYISNFNPNDYSTLASPFFGGGSFEFYLNNKYKYKVNANDKFQPLISFWKNAKYHKQNLIPSLEEYLGNVDKELFMDLRKTILTERKSLEQGIKYFILNRCSFSGCTLSGGFSQESSQKRFTQSSIDRVKKLSLENFNFQCLDFKDFLAEVEEDSFIFLDPPYYLKSKLYGKNGDLHEKFDHSSLHHILTHINNSWMLTYNDCPYIRELYSDFRIIDEEWSYGMNKTKKSNEIIIIK